jgi:hypothetical protein
LEEILEGFDPITLEKMDKVKLQDRIDTKFMFRDDILPSVLASMKEHYYALDIKGMRYKQ